MNPLSWIDDELDSLERRHLRRRPPTHDGPQSARLSIAGRELLNFGSNDYLALAADPRLGAAASEAVAHFGWGSGASPLVTGRTELHQTLERRLAEFEGTEAALTFSTGFAANVGAISALVGQGDAVYCDRKNHASIWDGCRLSRADVRVYPHNDCRRLAELLEASGRCRRRLIVTDGLFSMDGDLAPLAELASLAERHGAMLMVDEAHATGVFGRRGRGTTEHLGVEDRVHVRVGTLSKALGCSGGFVAGPAPLVEWLVNRARSYVFSTAAPPACSAAALAAMDAVQDDPQRRETLLARADALRAELRRQGWNTGASASQIIPLIVGEPRRATALAADLFARGLFVPAIRPPTVPEGEALLRISLTAGHSDEMIAALSEALARHV
ncbi:MAG: 8-amino-7-oxononanoate synthase [Pirellulales bacterium]|nr:8-amino-7-oxononanoate synthase [Pirellulales bacterium]